MMLPHKEYRFERSNARQWDTESNLSVASTASRRGAGHVQGGPSTAAPTYQSKSAQNFPPNTARGTVPTQHGPSRDSTSGYSSPYARHASANTYTTGANENHTPQGQQQQRHGNAYNSGSQRQSHITTPISYTSNHVRPNNSEWAVPPGLVTTRGAIRNSEELLKKAEFDSYCTRPDSNEPFAATGYYLWPKGCGDPMSLFDPTLTVFHNLRSTYKVHIDWNDKLRCLRINCSARGAEQNVADAIRGIKVLQRNAQAQVISASPEYIVVPPTANAMRSIVRPKATEKRENSVNPVVTSIELAGDRLSADEKLEWESRLRQINKDNYKTFRKHLINRTLPLGDLRGWMRMRVHFGHVNLSQYQDAFANGKYTFELFADMMKKARVATGGTFDRKTNAAIAMNLIKKIVGREQDFCPRKSTTPTLSAVLAVPKHTEIIFVTTPDGLKHRLEAEIEAAYVEEEGAKGKYQIGHTRLFANDRRNKRMEITTVDIEREFDWTVEIIQDGEIKEIPGALRSYIAASLDSRSEELVDPLQLPYPAIALRAPTDFMIQSVIMRSVFQYMWIDTSNIIEIAIYREWDSCNTKRAPTMQASVSMFNPDWDSEMESVENHMEGRNWDYQLHNFFGKDRVSHKNTGLSGLIHEIREVQGLLSEAAKVCTTLEEPSIRSGATTPSQDGLYDN